MVVVVLFCFYLWSPAAKRNYYKGEMTLFILTGQKINQDHLPINKPPPLIGRFLTQRAKGVIIWNQIIFHAEIEKDPYKSPVATCAVYESILPAL